MNNYDYDVLIIGGGPAGSTTAALLAEAGLNIALAEKKIFPREVMCGEFLSHEVISILSELNLMKEFLTLKPNIIKKFLLNDDSGKDLLSELNFPAYSLKRSVFDNMLLSNAGRFGTRLLLNSEVIDVKDFQDHHLIVIKNSTGQITNVTAKFVIGAYGKKNQLDHKFRRNFASDKTGYYGIKFHLHNNFLNLSARNQISIFTSNGIYCGVNSVNEDETTLCYLFNKKRMKEYQGDPLYKLVRSNEAFRKLFTPEYTFGKKNVTNYGCGNIYFGRRNTIENNIIMIGDAAGMIAPLAGDGIGMAMESAKLASFIIIESIKTKTRENILSEYQLSWEKQFHKRIRNAGIIQNLLLTKYRRKLLLSVAVNFPPLLQRAIKGTRKEYNM